MRGRRNWLFVHLSLDIRGQCHRTVQRDSDDDDCDGDWLCCVVVVIVVQYSISGHLRVTHAHTAALWHTVTSTVAAHCPMMMRLNIRLHRDVGCIMRCARFVERVADSTFCTRTVITTFQITSILRALAHVR